MFDALPPPSFWCGLRGKTRTNLILFVGAYPCVRPKPREPNLMIKRAHTEVRPYRLIVPVVLHFLLVLALASGEAERGEVRRGLSDIRLGSYESIPLNSPLLKGRNVLKAKPSRERLGTFPPPSSCSGKRRSRAGGGQEGIVSRMGLFGTDFTD